MAERAPVATVRAQAALFDGGRLLCARHRAGDADYWVLPGGHLEPGESLWGCLVRELREETGLVAGEGALWAVSEFRSNARHVVDVTFRVTRWEGTAALGSDPEAGAARLVGLAWHDRAALAALPFRPPILARRLLERWDAGADAAYLGVEEAA